MCETNICAVLFSVVKINMLYLYSEYVVHSLMQTFARFLCIC